MNFISAIIMMTLAMCMPLPPPIAPSGQIKKQENAGRAEVVETLLDVGWVGGGQSFNVIVLLKPDDGWHVYWKNPGASGAPTEIEIEAPEGFIIGEPIFPRPSIFYGEEGATYGYEKQVAIFVPVTAPLSLNEGSVTFQVATSWLSCRKKCVMGEQSTELTFSTEATKDGPPHRDARLARWVQGLPKPLSELEQGTQFISGNTLHISGVSGIRPLQFIGVERLGLVFGAPEHAFLQGDSFRLPVPIMLDFTATDDEPILIEGIVTLGRNQDDPSYVIHVVAYPNTDFH